MFLAYSGDAWSWEQFSTLSELDDNIAKAPIQCLHERNRPRTLSDRSVKGSSTTRCEMPQVPGRSPSAVFAALGRSQLFPPKIRRKNKNTFKMSRKIDAAINGAEVTSLDRRRR